MQPSLEKLRKFFRLEHENGYANSAIIGGLAKMLDFWEGEARVDGIQESVIQAVVQRLRSYDGLTPTSRADALKGLWKRIGETYPDTQQKPRNGMVKTNGQQQPRAPQPCAPEFAAETQRRRARRAEFFRGEAPKSLLWRVLLCTSAPLRPIVMLLGGIGRFGRQLLLCP